MWLKWSLFTPWRTKTFKNRMTKLKVQEQKRRVEHKHTRTQAYAHTHTDSWRWASIVYKQEHTHTHTFTHNYTIRWINELLNLSFDYLCVCVSIMCICMYMRRYRYQVFGTCKIYRKFADDVDLNLCKTQKGNKHTYIHMYVWYMYNDRTYLLVHGRRHLF